MDKWEVLLKISLDHGIKFQAKRWANSCTRGLKSALDKNNYW